MSPPVATVRRPPSATVALPGPASARLAATVAPMPLACRPLAVSVPVPPSVPARVSAPTLSLPLAVSVLDVATLMLALLATRLAAPSVSSPLLTLMAVAAKARLTTTLPLLAMVLLSISAFTSARSCKVAVPARISRLAAPDSVPASVKAPTVWLPDKLSPAPCSTVTAAAESSAPPAASVSVPALMLTVPADAPLLSVVSPSTVSGPPASAALTTLGLSVVPRSVLLSVAVRVLVVLPPKVPVRSNERTVSFRSPSAKTVLLLTVTAALSLMRLALPSASVRVPAVTSTAVTEPATLLSSRPPLPLLRSVPPVPPTGIVKSTWVSRAKASVAPVFKASVPVARDPAAAPLPTVSVPPSTELAVPTVTAARNVELPPACVSRPVSSAALTLAPVSVLVPLTMSLPAPASVPARLSVSTVSSAANDMLAPLLSVTAARLLMRSVLPTASVRVPAVTSTAVTAPATSLISRPPLPSLRSVPPVPATGTAKSTWVSRAKAKVAPVFKARVPVARDPAAAPLPTVSVPPSMVVSVPTVTAERRVELPLACVSRPVTSAPSTLAPVSVLVPLTVSVPAPASVPARLRVATVSLAANVTLALLVTATTALSGSRLVALSARLPPLTLMAVEATALDSVNAPWVTVVLPV